LDRAVDAGIVGSFFHQGQICMRNNRHLYIDHSMKTMLTSLHSVRQHSRLVTADRTTNIGPVINEKQKSKIMNLIQQSVEQGAKIITGGHSHGLVIEPTVMRNVTNDQPKTRHLVL
jgi:aldehyde dehydrogenase (NAD+)